MTENEGVPGSVPVGISSDLKFISSRPPSEEGFRCTGQFCGGIGPGQGGPETLMCVSVGLVVHTCLPPFQSLREVLLPPGGSRNRHASEGVFLFREAFNTRAEARLRRFTGVDGTKNRRKMRIVLPSGSDPGESLLDSGFQTTKDP